MGRAHAVGLWLYVLGCSAENPACAEGFHCDSRGEKLPWSCQPDTWHGG